MRLLVCLALSSLAAFAQPRIFYSDLDGGPRSGGENNQGAFVTIYGNGFGSSRGTSSVTVGGAAVAAYPVWTDTKVTVQIGANALSGDIRLTNSGGTSNGVPFAIRGGNIYFVGPSGADGNPGSLGAPWRNIQTAVDRIAPGDIIYLMNGTTAVRPGTSDGSVTLSRNNGTAAQPKALVAYPGAVASIGQVATGPCVSTSCIEGLRTTFASSYWTIAGLRLAGNDYALALRGGGLRIVGNDLTCPFGSGASACLDASQSTNVKIYGNDVHDAGYNRSSDLYHGVYFSTDSTNIDIGWNSIRNIQGCRGIQFNSTALDNTTGFNQHTLSVHDNYIAGTQCDGIVFSTVDPSQGPITVHNNVIVDAGRGPATFEGGGTFSCIYAAGYKGSRSGPGSGVIDVLHNTMVNCGGFRSDNGYGGVIYARRDTTIDVRIRNNIIVQPAGSPYWVNFDGGDQGLTGTNNLVFGNGAPTGTGPFGTIIADPIFLNPAAGDFRIATNSPARAAGLNTGLATDKNGVNRGATPDIGAYQAVAGSGSPLPGPASLTVDTAVLDFVTTQGSNPGGRNIVVGNVGQQSLDFAITSTQAWVQATPSLGTIAPGGSQFVNVAINAAALPTGMSTATLRVSGAGAQRDITVRVIVNPPGGTQIVLSASSTSFEFSTPTSQDPPAPQSFVVRNAGTPGFTGTWTSQSSQAWVNLFPNAGPLTTAGQTVGFEINPSGLMNGTYVATIALRSDGALNSPITLTVRLTIGGSGGGGGTSPLGVNPASLDITVAAGSNAEPRQLLITNNAAQALDANTSADQPWMQAFSQGGFGFLLAGASTTANVMFNTASLSAGTYSGTVRVGSGNTQRDIPVRLNVTTVGAAPPGLSVDNDTFNFITVDSTAEVAPQIVHMRHGGGTATWASRVDQSWLTLSPNAGIVNAAGQEIRLNVNASGLPPGAYTANVVIEAPGALNSPQRLTVRLNVGGVGSGGLSVSPSTLNVNGDQGGDAAAQTLFLSNTGAATAFTASAEPTWLRVSPASGFLTAGGGQALTVSFASAALAPGVYSGVVRVAAGGLQRDVTVRLTVTAGGQQRLAVSADALSFAVLDPGSEPPVAQALRLRNAGSGNVNWTSRSSQAWVELSPNAGSVSPAGQDISVNVNPSGLPAGTYTALVTLTGGSGAPVLINVRLTVGGTSDGGALIVSPPSIEISVAPGSPVAAQTVLIRNNGSSGFNYTAAPGQAWILVTPASGFLSGGVTQPLTVNFNTAALSSGTNLGSIRVQGGGIEREIPVRITIGSGGGGGASAAGFSASVDTFQFNHRNGDEDPPAPQTFRLTNSTSASVNWSARADQVWLTLSPSGGYLPQGSSDVSIVVNPAGLPSGTHTANVTLQFAGSPAVLRLTVRLTVNSPGLSENP